MIMKSTRYSHGVVQGNPLSIALSSCRWMSSKSRKTGFRSLILAVSVKLSDNAVNADPLCHCFCLTDDGLRSGEVKCVSL